MPALPHLSLLKCAGPKVNFIQVDSAEEVNAKKYSNIMAGELGIIMPVSMQVLIGNRGKMAACWFEIRDVMLLFFQ